MPDPGLSLPVKALHFASIAKGIRKDIFEHEKLTFSGHFPPNCQSNCIPYNLKLLISMIMFGPTLLSEGSINSQACLTIAQLILFNVKKKQQLIKRRVGILEIESLLSQCILV